MKLKWGKKKITLMIVPDVNRSVIRFHIPELIVIIIPVILLTLLIGSIVSYSFQLKNIGLSNALKNELEGQKEQFQMTITEKDENIDQLQNQILDLSEKAKQVETQLEELKKMKEEMESLTEASFENKEATVQISSLDSQHVGGENHSITEEDIKNIALQTKSSLSTLEQEMADLHVSLNDTKEKLEARYETLRITPTIWPSDNRRITSTFGVRRDPFTFRRSVHKGLDIGGNTGDPIYASADGKVQDASYDRQRGNNITIKHGNGISTIYMHLHKMNVKKGDSVKKGQKIGEMGSTGRSTGPHLHYEVLKNGVNVDPKPYIKSSRREG